MSEARIHPPSERRLFEARLAGHVPRAPLSGLFALVLGLAAPLITLAPALAEVTAALYRIPLEHMARGQTPSVAELTPLLARAAWLSGACLVCSCVLLALGSWLVQGPALGFFRARFAVPELAPGRTARVLFVLGLPLVVLSLAPRVLRVEPAQLGGLLSALALRVCGFLALCALLDASLARARHLRSLWLTAREHKDELREAYGSPELRRGRERVRREAGQS